MATDVSSTHVNGNYQQYNGYAADQYAQPNSAASQQTYGQSNPSATGSAMSNQPADIPKDEVGWYFVEQYYTTLSRSPEKLYLYYNKRSQYVCGNETDKVQVCVGQRAIHDRIKELDFQDCKVRITNVDSQASDANIVIQVIGEISNKSKPHRKFCQTFILATQTNGYFVLNDIFRYIIDEEEEHEHEPEQTQEQEPVAGAGEEEVQQQAPAVESVQQESAPAAEETEPKNLTSSEDPAEIEHTAQAVDKELDQKVLTEAPKKAEEEPAKTNGVAAEEPEPEQQAEETAAEPTPEPAAEPEQTELTPPEAVEEPKSPVQTPAPVASPPKPAAAQPAAPSKPAAPALPKTWANLAAAAARTAAPPTPAAPAQQRPAPAASKSSASVPSQAAAPAAPAQATPAPSAPAAQREEPTNTDSQDEWVAVSSSHNRQQSRQVNGPPQDAAGHRGYIKNVHEHVKEPEFKAMLEKFGKVAYLDIARPKNCAFVDFESAEAYSAAVAANPHQLGNDKFWVEERRPRPGNNAPFARGAPQFQGGRGRGDFRGGRGNGFPRGGRGGNAGRGGARGGAAQAS